MADARRRRLKIILMEALRYSLICEDMSANVSDHALVSDCYHHVTIVKERKMCINRIWESVHYTGALEVQKGNGVQGKDGRGERAEPISCRGNKSCETPKS